MDLFAPDGFRLPTRRQQLLLKAALFQGEQPLAAWREWRARGLDDIDWGSFRLLPQLYRNLQAQHVDDPFLPKLRGIYRRFWYENQVRFRAAEALLRAFQQSGIETMLIKGAALIPLYYRDSGARPMNDVDIVVPERRLAEAMELMKQYRFSTDAWIPETLGEGFLRFRHAISYEDNAGLKVDLHWHALYLACFTRADEMFWGESVPMEFQGVPARALNAADQFMHTCVHGALGSEPGGAVRWIADAVTIFNSTPKMDWNRILLVAKELGIALPLGEALRYLKEQQEVAVPAEVLETLERQPVSRAERLFLERVQLRSQKFQGPVDTLRALYFKHSSSYRDRSTIARLAAFPSFLQCLWNLPSARQLVPQTCRWAMMRFKQ